MKAKRIMAGVLGTVMACGLGVQASSAGNTVAAAAPKTTLKNKTVKILSDYDMKDNYETELFKKNYGGKIDCTVVDWDSRFDKLSSMVLGGEGLDLFNFSADTLPLQATKGLIQPIDEYIPDIPKSKFQKFGSAMEAYNFGGKHYAMVTNVVADSVVLYNKDTIAKYELDDPYQLWQKGEWNWDTFKNELEIFKKADKKNNNGLDDWFFTKTLIDSAGVPVIGNVDGKLKSNIGDKTLYSSLKYAATLKKKGLIYDFEKNDWTPHPEYMGTGQELFHIVPIWAIQSPPSEWSNQIPAKKLGMVPVPSPAGSPNYMAVSVNGLCLCTGAPNPEGAVVYAELALKANTSSEAKRDFKYWVQKECKWSNEVVKAYTQINKEALENPVFDIYEGISDKARRKLDDDVFSVFHGNSPSNAKNAKKTVQKELDKLNKELAE